MLKITSKLKAIISISNIRSVSPLGSTPEEVWQSYLNASPVFSKKKIENHDLWVSSIPNSVEKELQNFLKNNPNYQKLDRSVQLVLLASKSINSSEILSAKNTGVNIGSSRGATHLFEQYHEQFLAKKNISALSSPSTTLGNISSWLAQELSTKGPQISHSITCSTAMHSILNGIAWLQADMADAFIVGGTEAPLTSFTLAQMQALKLYSKSENDFACESMNFQKKKNTMVLGEAAALAILEKGINKNTQAIIKGYGYASEKLEHSVSISKEGLCFQKSMAMALQNAEINTVDAIVLHAPGTVKGDLAEREAIHTIFNKKLPLLTSNKWLLGHTFGASGMMSMEMAILMLQHNHFMENPFYRNKNEAPSELKIIMVNAVGFGGNAVSIIVEKPKL